MEKHQKLTESRIYDFMERIWQAVYEQRNTLKAKFTHGVEPIPFRLINKGKWKEIKPGERWGGNWESAWFRFSGKIPSAWKGKEVVALFDVGSEACIFDKTGTPIQGLTSSNIPGEIKYDLSFAFNHDAVVTRKALFPVAVSAKGSEKVDFLIEAAANQMFGHSKDCYFREANLVIFNRNAWEFLHEYVFLLNMMYNLPFEHLRRAKIMYGLNEVINNYFSPADVSKCRKILQPLLSKRSNASASEVSAIGHSHIDTAWLWPLRETVRKVSRTFSTAIKYMQEYPEYKFGASQPQLYAFAKKHYPGLYKKIKEAVKAGRWEVQGGMWVEADTNVTSGESLVRQILHGKRFFEQEFGIEVKNLWIPDVFGYSGALPQILKKSGIDYFLTTKMTWSQFNTFPYHTFLWEGIDGSRVFSHFPPSGNYGGDLSPGELMRAQRDFAEKDRANNWAYLYGFGDGGGGPSRHQLEYLKLAKDVEEVPKVKSEFASVFFKKAEASIKDPLVWRGELYLERHRGTLTTQAHNKRANRKSELLLRETEWMRTFNMTNYPQIELDRLWKLVLLNQFHDIIPGSSITWVYKDSQEQYKDVLGTSQKLLDEGAKSFTKNIDTIGGKGKPVVVTNSLSWDRQDVFSVPATDTTNKVIKDLGGNAIPTQKINKNGKKEIIALGNVPSMGYCVFFESNENAKFENSLRVSKNLLENENLKVRFDEKGYITSIFDKENNQEVLPEGAKGNMLALYDEYGQNAWEVDIYYEEKKPSLPVLTKSGVAEKGPVRASILQEWRISENSSIVQEIRLIAGSRKIEFFTKVKWHENEKMLRTSFPTTIDSENATYEIQFGNIKRPTHRNTSWDMARFEMCGQKWADLSEKEYGVAILNDCKYGHKIHKNVIDLALLRSPKTPDPVADMGEHVFTYAIYPHKGSFIDGDVVRAGYELNVPMRAYSAEKHKGRMPALYSEFNIDNEALVIDTVKKAEDSKDIIIRIYEAFGSRGSANLSISMPVKKAFAVNLLERQDKKIVIKNGNIKFNFKPFEIITFKLVG